MTSATVKWAAERCQKALKELEAHGAETKRLVDAGAPFDDVGFWPSRTIARSRLVAQVAETARALVDVVLKEGA